MAERLSSGRPRDLQEGEVLPSREEMLQDITRTLDLNNEQSLQVSLFQNPDSEQQEDYVIRLWEGTLVLKQIFKPERIPNVIRRQAESFRGSTGLDLILEGKIDGVVGVYSDLTLYHDSLAHKISFWKKLA